jgi:SAM-dependent methyltransferase
MDPPRRDRTRTSYDVVADEYVARIGGELDRKPFDRELLARFAERVKTAGPATDVGCGPGHVTRYLRDQGVRVCGVDLSGALVKRASALNPDIGFVQADMRALPASDGAWAGMVVLYSLIHIPRGEVVHVLREFKRALQPGGLLLLGFHEGDQVLHMDEWWDHRVSVDFIFFQGDEMRGYLQSAALTVEEVLRRPPYAPDVEHQSPRCYVLARA